METQFVVVRESEAQYITDSESPLYTDGNWVRVPKKFIKRQAAMSAAARAVFMCLVLYINTQYYKETGKVKSWPGYSLIRQHTGITDKSIRRALVELDDLGYIINQEFDYPPYQNPYENKQPIWIFTLGETQDDQKFLEDAMKPKSDRWVDAGKLSKRCAKYKPDPKPLWGDG